MSSRSRTPIVAPMRAGEGTREIASTTGCAAVTLDAETAGETVVCSATNGAGLTTTETVVVRIDKTPPAVFVTRTPPPNANGWNNSPVTAHFAASDPLSGIAGTITADITFANDGMNQEAARTFVDIAGNSVTAQIDHVNIDTTPPTITCTADPGVIWPFNHKMRPVSVDVHMNDALSGAGTFTLTSISSSEADPGAIAGFVLGSADTHGLLAASRRGDGDGRTYTLMYTGYDLAENTTTCQSTVSAPHDRSAKK